MYKKMLITILSILCLCSSGVYAEDIIEQQTEPVIDNVETVKEIPSDNITETENTDVVEDTTTDTNNDKEDNITSDDSNNATNETINDNQGNIDFKEENLSNKIDEVKTNTNDVGEESNNEETINLEETSNNENYSNEEIVSLNENINDTKTRGYEWTVTPEINFKNNSNKDTQILKVSVTNNNIKVKISLTNNNKFELTSNEGVKKQFEIYKENTKLNAGDLVLKVLNGSVDRTQDLKLELKSSNIDYAGNYTGQVTFVAEPQFEDALYAKDIITIEGKDYIIIENKGNDEYLLLTTNSSKRTYFNDNNDTNYKNSNVDKYLNNEYYNSLSSDIKKAIIPQNIKQYEFEDKTIRSDDFMNTGNPDQWYARKDTSDTWHVWYEYEPVAGKQGLVKFTNKTPINQYDVGQRNVYLPSLLDIQKIVNIDDQREINSFFRGIMDDYSSWIRDKMGNGVIFQENRIMSLNNWEHLDFKFGVYPSFVLDLSKIDYNVKFKALRPRMVIGIEGKEYTIIEHKQGSEYLVLAPLAEGGKEMAFDGTESQHTTEYKSSDIAKYLNEIYYQSLPSSIKNAIVINNVMQNNYSSGLSTTESKYYKYCDNDEFECYNEIDKNIKNWLQYDAINGLQGYHTFNGVIESQNNSGNYKVFLPSVSEIKNIVNFNDQKEMEDFLDTKNENRHHIWLRDTYKTDGYETRIMFADYRCRSLNSHYAWIPYFSVHPAFVIDLSNVNYIVKH